MNSIEVRRLSSSVYFSFYFGIASEILRKSLLFRQKKSSLQRKQSKIFWKSSENHKKSILFRVAAYAFNLSLRAWRYVRVDFRNYCCID